MGIRGYSWMSGLIYWVVTTGRRPTWPLGGVSERAAGRQGAKRANGAATGRGLPTPVSALERPESIVQEEDPFLVLEEDLLLAQEEDLLLAQEEDLLLAQEEDLLLAQAEVLPIRHY